MISCAYCGQPATMRILSVPEQVCPVHAREFWTGLLSYASSQSGTCVKHERLCSCAACEQVSMSELKSVAVNAVGESPKDHEGFALQIAS
jgi:hypothetical protein